MLLLNMWTSCLFLIIFSLSLEVMTLNPVCENVETSEGVPLTVTGNLVFNL